jgi:hypothetical protein
MMQFTFNSFGNMEEVRQRFIREKRINGVIVALAMLTTGVAFIAAQAGYPQLREELSLWWPSLIIAVAAVRLLFGVGSIFWSTASTVIFGILQLEKLGTISSFWDVFWPALLVIYGVSMLFRRIRRTPKPSKDANVISGAVVEYTDNDQ